MNTEKNRRETEEQESFFFTPTASPPEREGDRPSIHAALLNCRLAYVEAKAEVEFEVKVEVVAAAVRGPGLGNCNRHGEHPSELRQRPARGPRSGGGR